MTYYKQLDGLRAIAVIGVMIAHWLETKIQIDLLKNIPYGSGVTLFFVLSGFLITKIIIGFKEKNKALGKSNFHSVKAFYVRRSLRIFPIYYLTIFLAFIYGIKGVSELWPWLVTYTTNIYMVLNGKYVGTFTHFWSLAVEEQFYLFWVFVVIYIPKKHLRKTILITIALSLLLLYYFKFHTQYWLAEILVICSMHTLGIGALIAYYVKYDNLKINNLNLSNIKTLLLFLFVFYVIVFIYRKPDDLYLLFKHFKNPILTLIYGIVVLIAIKDGFKGIVKHILENKIMVYIGRISYGLYIYHLFMMPIYFRVIHKYFKIDASPIGYFFIYLALNIVISSISWYLIEKPINNLKRFFNY